jgi:hypothetical protein
MNSPVFTFYYLVKCDEGYKMTPGMRIYTNMVEFLSQ